MEPRNKRQRRVERPPRQPHRQPVSGSFLNFFAARNNPDFSFRDAKMWVWKDKRPDVTNPIIEVDGYGHFLVLEGKTHKGVSEPIAVLQFEFTENGRINITSIQRDSGTKLSRSCG